MKSMAPLRISAISFLNTAPLMRDFEYGETAESLREHFQFSYTIPSQCAEELKSGAADIGIVPVAAYTSIPGLLILPGVSIASKNQVRSILLVSKVPLEKIRSVATDNSSRTSAALVEVFLRKFVGAEAGFISQPPVLAEMLRWHDAGLLIGDQALLAKTSGYYVFDLAEEWRRWTGHPFVFAFWTVRRAALRHLAPGVDLAGIFQRSRDHGLQDVPEIVRAWAPRLGLPEEVIHDYLTQNIDYSLDRENLAGLKLFFRYAAEYNVLPAAPELHFVDQPSMAARL